MFNKIFNFFNFKKGVPFDPKLIERFNNDHSKLVNIAVEIKHRAKDTKSPMLIKSLLKTLKNELFIHFIHEEKTLYKYLNALYKNDKDNKELVQEFNSSMHDIQKVVEEFMEEYTSDRAIYNEKFISRFDKIIDALLKRIDTEENHLYSLYNKKIKVINVNEFDNIKEV